ncbi:hypothetical protein L6164_002436 [Bauhinia variegata]|uniref:Uncharacterized protein n=1 Tax=Bauhinia variegata TaxID=167791 RepID=A0ACB9PYS2_BAUVA|nr:hypothetical protein L6164_002436 [Bauhinia variegata]
MEDDEMGFGQSINLEAKPMRRRGGRRKRDCSSSKGHSIKYSVGNRREIAYALQMQRSSPSPPCIAESEAEIPLIGKVSNFEIDMPMFSGAQYCYSLLEAMPLPEPIWSTTSPCVLAEPPAAPNSEASMEFEWAENQASLHSWWLEFLKSLDGNMGSEKLNCSFLESNIVVDNAKVLNHESPFVDGIDDSCCADDWLMIPSMDKDLGDMVMP